MLTVKNYKLFHRSYLTNIIQKQRENRFIYPPDIEYPAITFEKDLESKLVQAGFFDKFSKNIWWRQEFDHFNHKTTFLPENVD